MVSAESEVRCKTIQHNQTKAVPVGISPQHHRLGGVFLFDEGDGIDFESIRQARLAAG